jgi:PAS domain S-box-containing protein
MSHSQLAEEAVATATPSSGQAPTGLSNKAKLRYAGSMAVIAIAYRLSAEVAEMFSSAPSSHAPIWLPAGIAFAAWCLFGYRAWPGVLAGAVLFSFARFGPGATALVVACGATTAAAALWFLRRTGGLNPSLETVADVARLVAAAALASTLAATFAVAGLALSPLAAPTGIGFEWSRRLLADFTGILVISPVLLSFSSRPLLRLSPKRSAEALALGSLLVLSVYAIFASGRSAGTVFVQVEYLILPLTSLIAIRFGQRAGSLAALLTAGVACWGTVHNLGPYTIGTFTERSLLLDVYLSVTISSALTLGAANAHRWFTQAASQVSDFQFRTTFERAAIGMAHVSPDGTFIRVNENFCETVGYPSAELLRCTFVDITHPADLNAGWAQASALLRGEIETYSMVKRYLHKAGHMVWVQLSVSLVRKADGLPDYFIAVIRDISDRIAVAEQLRKAEEKFRWLVDSSPVGVAECSVTGAVHRGNQAFYNILGREENETVQSGLNLVSVTPDDWLEISREHLEKCRDEGRSALFEKEYFRLDGSRIPVVLGASIHPDSPGEVLVFLIDLTALKQKESQLGISEDRMRVAQETARFGVFDLNLKSGELIWSEGSYLLYGVDPGVPVSPALHMALIVPEDRERVEAGARAGMSGDDSEIEYRIRRADGEIWISSKGRCLYDSEGIPERFVGVSVNITERKLAAMALLEASSQLEKLANAMPQIVWTCTPDGTPEFFNQRWYDFTGLPKGGESGNPEWPLVIHSDDLAPVAQRWSGSTRTGELFELQYRLRDGSTGQYHWHLGRALPIKNEAGAIIRWVGTATDIDDYKHLSEELERRVELRTGELRQTLQEKTILLKELHHRVKNNLQVICSLLSMQMECAGGVQFAAPLLDAYQRVQSISLVHERLYQSETLAKLDFKQYVAILARDLFEVYCVDNSRVSLELLTDPISIGIDEAIPCGLILNELLSNALKHAFPAPLKGTITVSWLRRGDRIEISVSDNGAGLPATFNINQTGSLGFQVVRALAGQLNAELKVSSSGGSCISVSWVPIPEPVADARVPEKPVPALAT